MDLNRSMVDMYKKHGRTKSTTPNRRANVETQQQQQQRPVSPNADQHKRRHKLQEILATFDHQPRATFDTLHGCHAARDQVLKIVQRFKRSIDGQAKKSAWPTLICGSRGLGKSSIVEAAANYAQLKLIPLSLKNLLEQTRNEFKATLKLFVSYAISNQPAVVLIDDLEQLKDRDEMKHLLRGAIKRLLDTDDLTSLLLFCTTSSIVDVDSRGLDFLLTINLKRPDTLARLKILSSLRDANKNLVRISNQHLETLAASTPSFTALDLAKMFDIAETDSDGQPDLLHCDRAVNTVRMSFKRSTHLIGERPTISWTDIGGLAEVKSEFTDILKQIKKGDATCKFAGIALYGPPGCGKTMVAQAMANQGGFNFISIKPAELVDKFLGETEKNIRRVFSEAQEYEPCMIYFDEFDGLCGTRGNRDTVTSAIQTLLSEIDGFASRGKSIILASTNRLEDIDPAMKRPGRLSKHIFVGPPNKQARFAILQVATQKSALSLSPDVDLTVWADKTENFSGADLDFLISEAESQARIELDNQEQEGQTDNYMDTTPTTLGEKHIELAMDKIRATNRELFKKIKR